MKIMYKDTPVNLIFAPYLHNSNTSIQLIDAETNQLIATATTNMEERWSKNYVAIMSSSNQDIVDALINQNIVEPTPLISSATDAIKTDTDAEREKVNQFRLTETGEIERARQYAENEYEKLFTLTN